MTQKPDKPYFNKRIFWQVDADKVDVHTKANFIVERVFDIGALEDKLFCRRFYGDEKVKEVLLNAKYLEKKPFHWQVQLLMNLKKYSDVTN